MEMTSYSSKIYAPPHGHLYGMACIRPNCTWASSRRFHSDFGGLAEVRRGSRIGLITPRSREKKKKGLCWRNVQTDGQDLQTDDVEKPNFAILIEVEGVIADFNRSGNRHAFNVAFQKLGLDCANWTHPVYRDLISKAGGDEERMLVLFFERRCALEDYVTTGSLCLRPGIEKFIDDAFEEQIPVIILSAYGRNGEGAARCIVEKLGPERICKTRIVGQAEVEKSFYGQLVLGKGVSTGIDEQLANEAAKAVASEKERIAQQVASMLNLSVDIDTTPNEMSKKVIASLRAGAEYAGMPVQNCILLSGSQTGVCAAERIGLPCVVIRNSSTSKAEFPSARAVMEGFGFGDLTVSKICRMAK